MQTPMKAQTLLNAISELGTTSYAPAWLLENNQAWWYGVVPAALEAKAEECSSPESEAVACSE